jgi:hypothetical protein
MVCYHHTRFGRVGVWFTKTISLLGLVFWVLFSTWIIGIPFMITDLPNRVAAFGDVICIGTFLIATGMVVTLSLFNSAPEICLDETGISINFMFHWVKIPWAEILEVRTIRYPFRRTIVLARKITRFHRIYGLVYGLSLKPGFLIAPTIERRGELIAAVQDYGHPSRR